jgi:hypothetical protein
MARTPSKGSSEKNSERDRWSKAQIVLVPVVVAAVGFFGSNYLSKRQELDTRARVYAELLNQREQAESALRKDMFVSIIDSFFKPEKTSPDLQVLSLELLAYNFQESLNLKPLFAHLRRTIYESQDAKKEKLLSRLEKVAGDVTNKQMLVLTEVGQKFDSTIDLVAVRDHPEQIAQDTRTLKLNGIQRTFRLLPLKVNFDAHELQFRLEIITPESSESHSYQFWIGFYDFPMIDNTRLAHDLRCAVVLNAFDEDRADVTLIYFPGSRASLKEKLFYEDVIPNVQATPEFNPKK